MSAGIARRDRARRRDVLRSATPCRPSACAARSKRQNQYAKKKAKRAQEWEEHLRKKTGVDGFAVLYEILELPPRKLASKEAIKRAYRLQSLRYHPDKVSEEQQEEAKEKFVAIQTAYELLIEGMETGGEGMGGAVFSGGDLQWGGAPGADGAAGAGGGSGLGAADVQAAAASADASSVGAADGGGGNGGGGVGDGVGGGGGGGDGGDGLLSDEQLALLLEDATVQRAMAEIGADPEAVVRYQDDAVVMGVVHTLSARPST